MGEWQDHLDMQKSDVPCEHCRPLVVAERKQFSDLRAEMRALLTNVETWGPANAGVARRLRAALKVPDDE